VTFGASRGPRPTLALVGATGAVGSVTQQVLGMRADIWGEIRAAAAAEDAGVELAVCGRTVVVRELTPEFFDGVDIALVDLPPSVAAIWAPVAAARGAVVIDNSSALRNDPEVPLVVPEVNPAQVRNRPRGIIANPGATTLTMIDVLGVLHAGWELTELVVASYQAASGAGRAGMARLYDELEVVAGHRELGHQPGDIRRIIEHELGADSPFPAPLALNVVPWIGSPAEDGWTTEELKIRNETRKVLGLPELRVSATCVRVPVVTTHSVAVHATFSRRICVEEARQALIEAPAVVVLDDPDVLEFPTPTDAVGSDPRFAGRLRQALDFPNTLDFFICGDNLRKGAALNMVQVAELVARDLVLAPRT
jgi:aspartate-semialdehyde dehydrogenase